MQNVLLQADQIWNNRVYNTKILKTAIMILERIEGCKEAQTSFIHVRGKLFETNEQADFVVNVDKIDYIKGMEDDRMLISFSGIKIIVDYNYYDFNEVFMNNVNLILHLNID